MRFRPQVWTTAVIPSKPPRRLGSLASCKRVAEAEANRRSRRGASYARTSSRSSAGSVKTTWKWRTGRILAALASWLALCLALSPVLAASAIAWGLSSATILSCLLCWLTAYLVGASAGFCSMLAFSGSDGFVGLLIYLGWILSSFFAAPFKFSNPFIQAWSLLRLEGGSAPYSGILAEAIVAAGLFAASALVLSARRRKRDA